MKDVIGGVCAPKGFKAWGLHCGIKADSEKKDLALIFSEKICNAAGMFTTNRMKGASVLVSQESLADGKLHAIIANSGNANACTGQAGLDAARGMAELAARETGVNPADVAVASTGPIGVPLPMEPIQNFVKPLAENLIAGKEGHDAALEAIMTSDGRAKEVSVEIEIDGKPVRIGGMVKGGKMLHPNMATLLCFLTTDAKISPQALERCLRPAVQNSFNRLTVDGDTSPNDTVIIMANGEAGNSAITAFSDEIEVFSKALEAVCILLAKAAARDGDGATKLISVTVAGAPNDDIAANFARTVAASNLVKSAFFSAGASWARALCAAGYAGDFEAEKTSLRFQSRAGSIEPFKNGSPAAFCEKEAKEIFLEEEVEIIIDLGGGFGKATAWGCNLTLDYISMNGAPPGYSGSR
ncbi:MAG: bifunctional ornithine acetyltransferase/N-acetylglutamate synthase [Spirochaetes bacterium]|nr:bifunctional ornithine acetyltransferase/N-acetylglutamate synthase [Spirochaetota bacterium]